MAYKTLAATLILILTGCAHQNQQAVRTEIVEVVRESLRPCPGVKPERPAPLERPLPTDANQLAALLGAKLGEYSLPGKWADEAEAIMDRCLSE